MNSAVMRNSEIDPFYSESNTKYLNRVINDVQSGRANLIAFTDEAWQKLQDEEIDFNAINRRAKYLFKKGIKEVTFDIEELEKWGKKSAFGQLSKYANPALIPLEESAWERAVVEKYGKNTD